MMTKYTEDFIYRTIKTQELTDALALVRTVFMRYEAPEYPEEGVQSFLDYIAPDSILEKAESGELSFWGCFKGAQVVGVCASRNTNHVCLMFVDDTYHRCGIGKRLFGMMAAAVESCGGYDWITVNSSPYAVPFYRSLGFRETAPEKTINGIRHTPMVYVL